MSTFMSSANPRIGSPNLSYRGTWHVLLCQTDLEAQIWPCLPSQPVALLRCRQVIVDFEWSGTVVWFLRPVSFSRLDTSRVRRQRLHERGLLFQPGACELSFARNPLLKGKSRSQTFQRILPAGASSAIVLVVNENSQRSHTGFLQGHRLQKASSPHHRAPCSSGSRALRMNARGCIGC